MSTFEKPNAEVDAWDHIYALSPSERDIAFGIVRESITGTDISGSDLEGQTPSADQANRRQLTRATRTILELADKGVL